MTELTFTTDAGPLSAVLDRTEDSHLGSSATTWCVTVDWPSYRRVRDERLFGLAAAELRTIEPMVAETAVQLLLKWVGVGTPPDPQDHLADSDWQLTEATQDRDGVQVGYRTERPDRIGTAVLDFLAADGWQSLRRSSDAPIETRYAGKTGEFDCAMFTEEDRQLIVTVAYLPVTVPESRRPAVSRLAELLTYRMDLGAVEIHPENYDVRVRHGIDVEDVQLSSALIRNVIYPVVVQAERFLPLLRAVVEEAADPVQVVEESFANQASTATAAP